jgi:hypothetical protein
MPFMMWRRRVVSKFLALACFMAVEGLTLTVSIPILFFRRALGIEIGLAYNVLLYTHLAGYVAETVLTIAMIYGVFGIAMRPFVGLRRIGQLIFRWVAAVSALLAMVVALGPQVFASGQASTVALTTGLQRVQDGVGVLTLCLLVFVCFAIKPLGLTYRSHIFGVALGLGVMSTVQLVQAAWFATTQAHSVYSPIYLVSTLGCCAAYFIWGTYFAMPEPARNMILLPTTSPYFRWNRISEALGDNPGQVAISGFSPEMMAPAELKVMTEMSRASRRKAAAALAQAEVDMEQAMMPVAVRR